VVDRLALPTAQKHRGRPFKYSWLTILKCGLVMVYYRLTSLRSLERFLHQQPEIALACGLPDDIPCYQTFRRRFQALETPAWTAARQLIQKLARRRWLRWSLLVIDGSLLAATGRPPREGKRPRPPTDPDASWGFSPSDGWVWGYRLHGLISTGPATAPVAWRTTTAKVHETTQVASLLRQTPRWHGKRRGWLVGDGGYDSQHHVTIAAKKRRRLVTAMYIRRWGKRAMSPARKKRWRFVHSPVGKRLLRRRTAIERDWSQLKHVFLLDPLPVTRLPRVQVYVSLVMVAYLAAVAYNGSMRRSLRAIKSLVA
jgi:hypothetical protein